MWLEHKRWIKAAVQYMEDHLTDDVDYEDIARHTAVSRFHLHRVFQAHVGMSASAYLRERRLAEAAIELLHTEKRILDIALEYRFSGQDSFTRAFKRQYQLTPQEYRKGFRLFKWMGDVERVTDVYKNEVLTGMDKREDPKGWMLTGVYPHQYRVGIDRKTVHRGSASGTIKAAPDADTQGFGTLMQMFRADRFREKRLRLSGFVKTENAHVAGVWLRIDGKNEEPIAFDNMQDRPIKGTTDWTPYEVVLDVGSEAYAVAFGVLLSGPGQVWIDGIRLEEVDTSVPVTDMLGEGKELLPLDPVNLDFEEAEQ